MSTAQNQNNLKAQNKKVIFIITFVGMLMLSCRMPPFHFMIYFAV